MVWETMLPCLHIPLMRAIFKKNPETGGLGGDARFWQAAKQCCEFAYSSQARNVVHALAHAAHRIETFPYRKYEHGALLSAESKPFVHIDQLHVLN